VFLSVCGDDKPEIVGLAQQFAAVAGITALRATAKPNQQAASAYTVRPLQEYFPN